MKSTSIVRRIDDLGRVVIPREIRQNNGIKEGDPLEICTEKIDGKIAICLTPYNHEPSAEEVREKQSKIVANFLPKLGAVVRVGDTTQAVVEGKTVSVTKYRTDKEDPMIALYELCIKAFNLNRYFIENEEWE